MVVDKNNLDLGFDFNPKVYFVCKLCKDAFRNVDNLMRHKKLDHRGEFKNIKYIIFEERFVQSDNEFPDDGASPVCETAQPVSITNEKNKSPSHYQQPKEIEPDIEIASVKSYGCTGDESRGKMEGANIMHKNLKNRALNGEYSNYSNNFKESTSNAETQTTDDGLLILNIDLQPDKNDQITFTSSGIVSPTGSSDQGRSFSDVIDCAIVPTSSVSPGGGNGEETLVNIEPVETIDPGSLVQTSRAEVISKQPVLTVLQPRRKLEKIPFDAYWVEGAKTRAQCGWCMLTFEASRWEIHLIKMHSLEIMCTICKEMVSLGKELAEHSVKCKANDKKNIKGCVYCCICGVKVSVSHLTNHLKTRHYPLLRVSRHPAWKRARYRSLKKQVN